MTGADGSDREAIARQLQRSVGALTTSTVTRMERDMPWFRRLSAEDRSWIGLIVQAGIQAFVAGTRSPTAPPRVTAEVFGAAPRALTGCCEPPPNGRDGPADHRGRRGEHRGDRRRAGDAPSVRDSIVRYAREVAFATAEVYARAAEMRGAWDARLEALVVDSVLRAEADETVRSRASALGWESTGDVVVVLGRVPGDGRPARPRVDHRRRTALGPARRAGRAVRRPGRPDGGRPRRRRRRGQGGRAAVAATSARVRWSSGRWSPDLVRRQHLRPRRDRRAARRAWLAGGPATGHQRRPAARARARRRRSRPPRSWSRRCTCPLAGAGAALLETLRRYLDHGGSIEGTARALFVHANTVRYRLRRAAEVTGLSPPTPGTPTPTGSR